MVVRARRKGAAARQAGSHSATAWPGRPTWPAWPACLVCYLLTHRPSVCPSVSLPCTRHVAASSLLLSCQSFSMSALTTRICCVAHCMLECATGMHQLCVRQIRVRHLCTRQVHHLPSPPPPTHTPPTTHTHTMPILTSVSSPRIDFSNRRVRGDAYYQLLDEFLTAVRRRYGNTTLIHMSDMAYDNAAKLLNMYRTDFPCFSDELQGLGAAVLAAILGSLPRTGGSLADHTVLLSGELVALIALRACFTPAHQ